MEGMDVVYKMEQVKVINSRPVKDLSIDECGVLEEDDVKPEWFD